MATLVAIAYPDQDTAEQARATVWRLEEELTIQAEEVAVISRVIRTGNITSIPATAVSRPRAERSGLGSRVCYSARCS